MKAKFSPLVMQKLRALHKKDKKLTARIEKQIKLFESNPKHSSLRTHKLTGVLSGRWSISVNRELRIIYLIIDANIAYFIDFGTHDEVYRR